MKEHWEYLIRYGKIITDDSLEDINGNAIRIRTIYYYDKYYYHKMLNGKIIEVKEITV